MLVTPHTATRIHPVKRPRSSSADRPSSESPQRTRRPERRHKPEYYDVDSRTSSCLQRPVAPRRQGPWVPAPSYTGVFGLPPFCALIPPTLFLEYLFSLAVGPISLWVASPGVLSQPPASLGRFWGRRPFVRSTIARWQEATDPQSPEGGSQRACTHEGCPPRGFWATQDGSVVSAVIPCPHERWR